MVSYSQALDEGAIYYTEDPDDAPAAVWSKKEIKKQIESVADLPPEGRSRVLLPVIILLLAAGIGLFHYDTKNKTIAYRESHRGRSLKPAQGNGSQKTTKSNKQTTTASSSSSASQTEKPFKPPGKPVPISKPSRESESVRGDEEVETLVSDGRGGPSVSSHGVPPKYGGPKQDTEADVPSGRYMKARITSKNDHEIRRMLDKGDLLLEQGELDRARDHYHQVLALYPSSPRANHGLAMTYDKLAEERRSNLFLDKAALAYGIVLSLGETPADLFEMTAQRLIDRLSFRGKVSMAAQISGQLAEKFPTDLNHANNWGHRLMIANDVNLAHQVFTNVLDIDPVNGFALGHLGFIGIVRDRDYEKAALLLKAGIDSGDPRIARDPKFYFQLGDALMKLGRVEDSRTLYSRAAAAGLFLSSWQRSLYNVDRLKGKPWWDMDDLPIHYKDGLKFIQSKWEIIRDEGIALLDSKAEAFVFESEDLRDHGTWKQFTLYSRGQQAKGCFRAPKTCNLLSQFADAAQNKRGQIKFSLMSPGTHVWPHCGPTNCRLRAHLGLIVPQGPRIRVLDETKTWSEGEFIILDDSFEHEVWHDGGTLRLILIVDIWHPELTGAEKRSLSAI